MIVDIVTSDLFIICYFTMVGIAIIVFWTMMRLSSELSRREEDDKRILLHKRKNDIHS